MKGFLAAADWVLDPSIVFSFDRTGFRRHARRFQVGDLDVDLSGRTCLVTGANSGIGYETALAFARRGARVWMLCRSEERGSKAIEQVRELSQNENVFLGLVDVSEQSSIAHFLKTYSFDRIDVLVHNAGVLLRDPQQNSEGMELTLATNLVGPMALTAGLLPALRRGEKPRMIWVSSGGMYTQKLSVGALKDPPGRFDGVKAYARTKRAMVVLSEQLSERLGTQGIAVHCMHPGWANTPGVEHSIPGFWRLTKAILRSPEEGADTVIWLGVSDCAQDQPGLFWFDRSERSTHLIWGTREAQDERESLWVSLQEWANLQSDWWVCDDQ